jgi:hypothetical protein
VALSAASVAAHLCATNSKGKARGWAENVHTQCNRELYTCSLLLATLQRRAYNQFRNQSYAQRNLNTVLLRYHLEYVLLSRLQTVSLTVLRYIAIRERLRRFVTSRTERTLLTFAADAYSRRPSLQVRRLFSVCRGENARRKRQPLGGAPLPILWWASVLTSIDDDSHDSSIRRSWLSKSLPVKS